jgi:DNA-binding MarR family transcriptional regulator
VHQETEGSRGQNSITERENNLEHAIQSCSESMGISLLSEWDILAFVYRHGPSLTNTDQIARLIGYESTVVGAALDRLERAKLIERSRPSQGEGVRLHRMRVSTDVRHRQCLQQFVSLSESRDGRLLLTKLLKPVPVEIGASKPSAKSIR